MKKSNKSFEENFEKLRESYQKFLLSSDVNALNLELKQPNIFNILRIEGTEIRHSNFLAWLLNPQESHGLGEIIFKRLVIELFFHEKSNKINDHLIHNIDYSKIEILREWNNIDILIKCPLLKSEKNNLIICIENKVKSKDSEGQLDNYFRKVNEHFSTDENEKIFVYLTLLGDKPTKKHDKLNYIYYSYVKIIDVIETTLEIYDSNISTKIKLYIDDYLSSIKRNFMEQDKTIDYAKKIYKEHKELIDFVLEKGIENKFQPAAKDFCDNLNLEIVDSGNNYVSFVPTGWVSALENLKLGDEKYRGKGYPMAFEFEKKGESLNLSLTTYPFLNQNERREFLKKIQEFSIGKLEINIRESKKGMWTRILSLNAKDIKSWDDENIIKVNFGQLYDKIIKNEDIKLIEQFLEEYNK